MNIICYLCFNASYKIAMILCSCLILFPSANTCVTYMVDVHALMLSASRATTRDTCSCYRIGRRCRETSSWHVCRYKYSEPPFPRAAPVDEGKCIVSASWLFPRSLSIPFYLLCHGNIYILRDNTIKAGRVLADFWSISTFVCAKMPRTKKKNGRGKWASCRILWPCLFSFSMLLGFVVLCVSAAHSAVEHGYSQELQMLKCSCQSKKLTSHNNTKRRL